MPADPDDLLPHQRRPPPTPGELQQREHLGHSRIGRWGRPWSWLTAAVAILAVAACLLLLWCTE